MKKVLPLAALIAFCNVAQAETWSMSVELPDTNYISKNANLFAEDIRENTGGELEINVRSNSVLLTRPELKRGVQNGIVPIGEMLVSALGNEDSLFEVDSIPYLATSFDDSQKLWETARPILAEKLDQQGLVLVYGSPYPPQGIYTKDPVEDLSDLNEVRFRAYNASTSRLATLMGTIPTTVQPQEVPQAFSTGVINAMLTSSATGVNTQAWDYVEYYYDAKVFIPQSFVIANKRALNSLPENIQNAVLEAGLRAEQRGWDMAIEETESLNATLAENGIEVLPMPEKLDKEMKGIGETMLQTWLQDSGEEGEALLEDYRNLRGL